MFGNALADNNDLNNLNQQNLSRQPYKHPVDKSNAGNFEGATVTKEQAEIDKKIIICNYTDLIVGLT